MRRRPQHPMLVIVSAVLLALAGCTTSAQTRTSNVPTTSVVTSGAPGTLSPGTPSSGTPTSGTPTSGTPTSTSPATVTSTSPAADRAVLHARKGQRTRQGLWWGVDSVVHIDADSLANVRGWYVGSPVPLLWGRYLTGSFEVTRTEISFARAHGIGVYFIVPDDNCSACSGGDYCGNDRTAGQARGNARDAVRAAKRLRLPAGTTLYKDVEEVSACHGELTADYLRSWFHFLRQTRYVPAFYGNSSTQDYDFPRAYCEAAKADPVFAENVTLAQDEPEPQIGAPQGTVGPGNAPRFAPAKPSCAKASTVRIWQYKESGYSSDVTDADEIRPGTHGILAPAGKVT